MSLQPPSMSNTVDIQSLQEKIDRLNQDACDVRVHDLPKAFELTFRG